MKHPESLLRRYFISHNFLINRVFYLPFENFCIFLWTFFKILVFLCCCCCYKLFRSTTGYRIGNYGTDLDAQSGAKHRDGWSFRWATPSIEGGTHGYLENLNNPACWRDCRDKSRLGMGNEYLRRGGQARRLQACMSRM